MKSIGLSHVVGEISRSPMSRAKVFGNVVVPGIGSLKIWQNDSCGRFGSTSKANLNAMVLWAIQIFFKPTDSKAAGRHKVSYFSQESKFCTENRCRFYFRNT